MKILVVCRKHGERVAPFVSEQVEAMQALGNEVQYVTAQRGGVSGYVQLYKDIQCAVKEWSPDIIHAHFGNCGLVANIQRQVPVVTTYPGSDVNRTVLRPIAVLSAWLSAYNIYMSKRQVAKMQRWMDMRKAEILRYGIMLDLFQTMEQKKAAALFKASRPEEVVWQEGDKLVLFSSKFTRMDKDPELAKEVVRVMNERLMSEGVKEGKVHLLPLTGGYTKEEMMWLMNMVDAAIVTSKSEGSPQFTKEVMACGTPIVSVDVGDVAEQVEGLDGCWVVPIGDRSSVIGKLAEALEKAIEFGKTNGHQHIKDMRLDNMQVAKRILKIYEKILR